MPAINCKLVCRRWVNYNGRCRALRHDPKPKSISTMLAQEPSEISFDWIYFPPFFFTVVLGFICALGIAKFLNVTGVSRFFWHPGLAFVALWVLATSVVGLFLIAP